MDVTIWAFAEPKDKDNDKSHAKAIYESVKRGKSRFGWSSSDDENLTIPENWKNPDNSDQGFLMQINPGDWIVHVNVPSKGKCTAAKVVSEYQFDAGIKEDGNTDFRSYFDVDIDSVVEFDRNRAPSSVNLKPGRRQHKVYADGDFKSFIETLKAGDAPDSANKNVYYLREKTAKAGYLAGITRDIQAMNPSKELERFLAAVFRKIPNVTVKENGFGWGTDHGADLIVDVGTELGNLQFNKKVVVQVKSYKGDHDELDAVEHVKTGIEEYKADAGMIITTAKSTEALKNKIREVSKEIGCQIDLLAGEDVAKFVMRHAPDMVFNLQ